MDKQITIWNFERLRHILEYLEVSTHVHPSELFKKINVTEKGLSYSTPAVFEGGK